jgi:hypothetical protein
MIRSRLTRRIEQKTRKNLALSLFGIILAIILALRFGIPLLVNFSLFLSGFQHKNETTNTQSQTFIAPPVLDSLPQATSSADIVVSGITSDQQNVNLYINDNFVNTSKSGNDGKFTFRETVNPGENIIKAKAVVNDRESDFSNTVSVIYKSAPPSLNVTSPSDNQTFSKDQGMVEVKGVTDPNVRVTVNGYWAITDDNGNYSYNLTLQGGENKIKIIAQDIAGNKAEKEIKVTYSP